MRARTERTCQFCGKVCFRREHYERHVRTHTGERPFECLLCDSGFARRDTWRRHVRACHPVENPLPPDADTTVVPNSLPREEAEHSPFIGSSTSSTAVDQLGVDVDVADLPLDWHWDPTLDLEDTSFLMEGLSAYDLFNTSSSLSWLPMSSSTEQGGESSLATTPKPSVQHWFTSVLGNSRAQLQRTPLSADSAVLTGDQLSREALASSLQQRIPDTPLPSTQFLNRCIHIFTIRLWHLIPIIHLPTFRPARTNPLLLLSICSLGALAYGSQDAVHHAERLFQGVHKAILVMVAPGKAISSQQSLAILQAAAIGQTFSLLSGRSHHLTTSLYFHGTLSYAVHAFQSTLPSVLSGPSPAASDSATENDWDQWIQNESVVRLVHAICIQNGEISNIFQTPASFRSNPVDIRGASPDCLFLTKTRSEWAAVTVRSSSASPYTAFSLCATIECFMTEIYHSKIAPSDELKVQNTQALLGSFCSWFEESAHFLVTDSANRLSTLMLCHSCFLSFTSDIGTMEKICGRDGNHAMDTNAQILRSWATTTDARRSVIHATFIFMLLERFRVSDVPPVHVARASWHAGLVLAVYSFLACADDWGNIQELADSCAELRTLQRTGHYTASEWAIMSQTISPERCKALAFSITTMLRHLGPWQIAARYAETLEQAVNLLEST